jgi:hypothetical protein
MQIHTKEHQDIIKAFENLYTGRFDKEDKETWAKGYVYQDGELNKQFIAFRNGYSAGRSAYLFA